MIFSRRDPDREFQLCKLIFNEPTCQADSNTKFVTQIEKKVSETCDNFFIMFLLP